MAGTVNPYAARARVPGEAPGPVTTLPPHLAYAVPDTPESTNPENTDGGYSPALTGQGGSGTLPDAIRVGREDKPGEQVQNEPRWWARRSADRFIRQADEVTSESWDVQQHRPPVPIIPEQVQERAHTRPTGVRSPLGYAFTRPWHIPRNVKDAVGEQAVTHVSLADHRRAFEIYGQAPPRGLGVNTYRKDPAPWDRFLLVQSENAAPATGIQRDAVQAGNRSFRLGG